jgi:hypothetical protein
MTIMENDSLHDSSQFQDLTEIDLIILERKINCLHNFTNTGSPASPVFSSAVQQDGGKQWLSR